MENDFRKNMVGAEAYSHLMEFIRVNLHLDNQELKLIRKKTVESKKEANLTKKKQIKAEKKEKRFLYNLRFPRVNLEVINNEFNKLLDF